MHTVIFIYYYHHYDHIMVHHHHQLTTNSLTPLPHLHLIVVLSSYRRTFHVNLMLNDLSRQSIATIKDALQTKANV